MNSMNATSAANSDNAKRRKNGFRYYNASATSLRQSAFWRTNNDP